VKLLELCLAIETREHHEIDEDIFGNTPLIAGETEKLLAEGISIRWQGESFRKSLDFPTIINLSIWIGQNIAIPVAVGILSSYIYDKLKKHENSKVFINNQIINSNNKNQIEQNLIILINNERDPEK
jgi:hypothetical protein